MRKYFLIILVVQEATKERLSEAQNKDIRELNHLQHRLKSQLKTKKDENIDGLWTIWLYFDEHPDQDQLSDRFVCLQFNDLRRHYTCKDDQWNEPIICVFSCNRL